MELPTPATAVEPLTLSMVTNHIQSAVYAATNTISLCESREMVGGAHHVRQYISKFAEMEAVLQWANREEAEAHCQARWRKSRMTIRDFVDVIRNA